MKKNKRNSVSFLFLFKRDITRISNKTIGVLSHLSFKISSSILDNFTAILTWLQLFSSRSSIGNIKQQLDTTVASLDHKWLIYINKPSNNKIDNTKMYIKIWMILFHSFHISFNFNLTLRQFYNYVI